MESVEDNPPGVGEQTGLSLEGAADKVPTTGQSCNAFCVICCGEYPLDRFPLEKDSTCLSFLSKGPEYLTKDLYVYFVLKHCLEMPNRRLRDYLRNCPRPENWVRICETCNGSYVEECAKVFWELLEVRRRFREVRGKLIEVIKEAELEDEGRSKDSFALDIARETVRFVKKCQYPALNEKEAFFEGDALASEKEKMLSDEERKVLSYFGGDDVTNLVSGKEDFLEVDTSKVKSEAVEVNEEILEDDHFADFHDDDHFGDTFSPKANEPESDLGKVEVPVKRKRGRPRKDSRPVTKLMNKNAKVNQESVSKRESKQGGNEKDVDFGTEVGLVKRKRGRPKKDSLPIIEDKTDEDFLEAIPEKDNDPDFDVTEEDLGQEDDEVVSSGVDSDDGEEVGKVKKKRGRPSKSKQPLPPAEKKKKPVVSLGEVICPKCGRGYKTESHLRTHFRKNHEFEGQFPCLECDKKFANKYRFVRHMSNVHGVHDNINQKAPKYFCGFDGCGKSFLERNMLERHEILHDPPTLKCNICAKVFRHRKVLKRHLKIHESKGELTGSSGHWSIINPPMKKEPTAAEDDVENVTSRDINDLRDVSENDPSQESLALSDLDLDSDLERDTGETQNPTKEPEYPEGELTCRHCGKDYTNPKSLREHIKRVHRNIFTCHVCGKSFGMRYRYLRHLNTVHNEVVEACESYTCSFEGCGKVYRERNLFNNHLKMHLPPQLKCDTCGKMFRFTKHLNAHKRRHLTHGKRDLPCPHCEAMYSHPGDLRTHIREKHLGLRKSSAGSGVKRIKKISPHFCSHCGKEFNQRYKLNRHLSTVHQSAEHSKFACTFEGCDKVFPEKSILERHESIHRPPQETCHICGKRFRRKEFLKRHILRHESKGQKNFFCDQCPCAYGVQHDLRVHVRLKHPEAIGEKKEVYSCPHCPEVRSDKRALRSHVRRVHEKRRICCEVCGKMIQNTHMRHHIEAMHSVHRVTKPHKCLVCGKGFSRREYLKGHTKTHLPRDQQRRRRSKPGARERRHAAVQQMGQEMMEQSSGIDEIIRQSMESSESSY